MNEGFLYRQYFVSIKTYLHRYVVAADAEDLSQKVFLRFLKNKKHFRGDSSVTTWTYRIATNAAKNFLKRKNRKQDDSISKQQLEGVNVDLSDMESPEIIFVTNEMNTCI